MNDTHSTIEKHKGGGCHETHIEKLIIRQHK